VLFMTDQQRFDQVGFVGGRFETPALDQLAAQGATFTNAYSASTTCVPARSALLTGVQPHRLETQVNGLALREGSWTLPRALRAAGYQTALIGKMHFAPIHADHGFEVMRTCEHLVSSVIGERSDGTRDFDDYHDWLLANGLAEYRPLPAGVATQASTPGPVAFPYEASCHPTAWVERETNEYLDRRDPNRPMFLVVSFPHPHAPLDPPEPYASRFDPSDVDLPADTFTVNDNLPLPFQEALRETAGRYRPRRVDELGEQKLRSMLTRVRALVRQIDDSMGRLLSRLPLDRTLVAFTSDHGDYAGHRGLILKVPWIPFEDLVRVPFVVAGAGVAPGLVVDAPVQAFDFVPTCCDAAGLDVDLDQFDAERLWPLLTRDHHTPEHERGVSFATTTGWPGARFGSCKLVRHRRSGQTALFDLAIDPGETTNVIEDPAYRDRLFEVALVLHWSLERKRPDLPLASPSSRT
jgi:arylsulfatase